MVPYMPSNRRSRNTFALTQREHSRIALAGEGFLLFIFCLLFDKGAACGADPQLVSTAVPPAGFRALFDGQSLEGWHSAPRIGVPPTARQANAPGPTTPRPSKPGSPAAPFAAAARASQGKWEIHDGVLTGGQVDTRLKKPESGEEWGFGGWLMTDETFGDFELLVDARPDWPVDTGIYVRSTPLGQGFQILLDHRGDDSSGVGGRIGALYLRGIGGCCVSPYNFRWMVGADGLPSDVKLVSANEGVTNVDFAASSDDFRRAWRMNDWNTFRIRVVGELPRITIWINEVRVFDCDTATIQHPDYDPAAVKQLLGCAGISPSRSMTAQTGAGGPARSRAGGTFSSSHCELAAISP